MTYFFKEFEHVLEVASLENRFLELLNAPLETVQDMENWLLEYSILIEEIYETTIGHKIDFYLDTNDIHKKQKMMFDQEYIIPIMQKYSHMIDKRFIEHSLIVQLDVNQYSTYILRKRNTVSIYQDKNIEKQIEIEKLIAQYVELVNKINVKWDDEELPMFQVNRFLSSEDRELRKSAWFSIQKAQLNVKDEFEDLFQSLLEIRNHIAQNSGFVNYRDFAFRKLERFDYDADYCVYLANIIRKCVVPLKQIIDKSIMEKLGLESYKPWDLLAPIPNNTPAYPFNSSVEMLERGKNIFKQIDSSLLAMYEEMLENNFYDLEPRVGKSPGAYCLPMFRSKHSFFVMNLTDNPSNIRTFVHEIGHSFHNWLMKDIPLSLYRFPTMEIAEFASMTMEYLTLDYWNEFYLNEKEFMLSKKMQLETFITFLSTGIVTDLFQHWIYENPLHTVQDRNDKFIELSLQFYASSIDYSNIEYTLSNRWLQMRHIYESPFYSIEYIIANIAAVEMYRQFRQDKEGTIYRFKKALSLGSSVSMSEVYKTAGVSLHVTEKKLEQLIEFVQSELIEINKMLEKE